MESTIEFGKKWVKVNESVFYLSEHEVAILKGWYDWSVKYDTEASEEFRAEGVEYFAKAFEMLKPQDKDEAFHYLTILENAYVQTDYATKEIIDRIYANKMANAWVSGK